MAPLYAYCQRGDTRWPRPRTPGYKASKTYTCVTSIQANETCDPHKEPAGNFLLFSLNATKRSASWTVFLGIGKRKLNSMQWTA